MRHIAYFFTLCTKNTHKLNITCAPWRGSWQNKG